MRKAGTLFPVYSGLLIVGALILLGSNLLLGCEPIVLQENSELEEDSHHCCGPSQTVSAHLVDCLVPGQIRKLGSYSTYVSSRKPVKTTAQDCEIRGGEYVAHERATLQTALRVWLRAAQEGEVEAQRIVGKIFEEGMGSPPDLAMAAKWYRMAAAQGDAEALKYLEKINPEIAKMESATSNNSERHINADHITRTVKPPSAKIEIEIEIEIEVEGERRLVEISEQTQNEDTRDPIKSFQTRIEEYLATLKQASYAFNPPSPILVAKPTIVYLLIDPKADIAHLVEQLNSLAPRNARHIDSGETKWAQVMEASMSGDDFKIDPSLPVRKTLSPLEPAKWSWVVTPKHPGTHLPLSLTVNAIIPSNFAPPYQVVLLHKEIDVDVTIWWLFDHYFDKYWKWLLGGLAGLMTGMLGWWKTRGLTSNPVRKRMPFKEIKGFRQD